MSTQANRKHNRVIVGLGLTGLSCARYLAGRGIEFCVVDSREDPPGLAAFNREFPDVDLYLGGWNEFALAAATEVYINPGIALDDPGLQKVLPANAALSGDIDLFADEVTAPVIAISGSNAKSTVTTLVGDMTRCAGLNAGVGGNLGVPALDLVEAGRDCYVLELSSFQLERCARLQPAVACILNISQDHMDRHGNIDDYQQAKHRIYRNAQHIVYNRNDSRTKPEASARQQSKTLRSFGLDIAGDGNWGVIETEGRQYIARGNEAILATAELQVFGNHNLLNVMAAFAIGELAGLPMAAMQQAAREFRGLPHRSEVVASYKEVAFINDSKATNVGASIAALQGLASSIDGKIVLIAGGQGKGADFSALAKTIAETSAEVLLIGEDAGIIEQALDASIVVQHCGSLEQAVQTAAARCRRGDAVLFSPACASFDMFANFADRGEAFARAVHTWIEQQGGDA